MLTKNLLFLLLFPLLILNPKPEIRLLAVVGNGTAGEMAWSPDGNLLAVAGSLGVWLFDTRTPTASPRLLNGHADSVWRVSFSPDGRLLASNTYYSSPILLWDVETGEIVAEFEDAMGNFAFTPDGKLLITETEIDEGGSLKVWSVEDQTLLFQLEGSDLAPLKHITFNQSRMVGVFNSYRWGYMNAIKVWDTDSWQEVAVIPRSDMYNIKDVRISPDNLYLLITLHDNQLEAWSIETGKMIAVIANDMAVKQRLETITGGVYEEASRYEFTSDHSKLALRLPESRVIEIWDVERKTKLYDLPLIFYGSFSDLVFNTYGNLLAALESRKSVHIFTQRNYHFEMLNTIPLSDPMLNTVKFTATDKLVIYGGSKIQLWNPYTAELIREIEFERAPGTSITISPDASEFVVVNWQIEIPEMVITYRERVTGKKLVELKNEGGDESRQGIQDTAFTPDGQIIATAGWSVHLWDALTGEEIGWLRDYTNYEGEWEIQKIVFDPQGRLLAAKTGDGTVYIWDVQRALQTYSRKLEDKTLDTGSLITQLYVSAYAMRFNPVGSLFATGGRGSYFDANTDIVLYDTSTWDVVATLTGHRGGIFDIVFSPDGNLMVSTGNDGTIRFWEIKGGD